jgi:hypothetical protein
VPEPRYPGAFIAEGTGPPPIFGVDPGATVFLGPTPIGPTGAVSGPFASFADFEKVHGGFSDSKLAQPPVQRGSHLALAARAFFENGGKRLLVMRVGDAALPTPADYQAALETLRTAPGIAVVAAPGYSARATDEYLAIQNALIAHVADATLLRFVVLDPPPGIDPQGMLQLRASLDAARAALYYPWVSIADPDAAGLGTISVPPSGFVCGIFERVASELGLSKPPSDQALIGTVGIERNLTQAEAELLGQAGVNTLRLFPGRGPRVWGARTLSNEVDTRYVSVRRYTDYLIGSIDNGLQWVVFEPNREALWASVRHVVDGFLSKEWRNGGLVGERPQEAFFVRCDRTTMSQDDVNSGRLICVVGVATVRPAEFAIFRIGQWTADSDSPPDSPP